MINCLLEQLSKRDDTIFSYKNQVYNLKQNLSELHTAQSNSYNSIDNNDFMNKGDENNNKSNKSQISEFYDDTSFNKSFNAEVSIDDVINPYSEPTTELVISSYKNMNNDNNEMILKKEQKKIKQGKKWLIKISKKFLIWETILSNILKAGK